MSDGVWRGRFAAALEQAALRAETAQRDGSLIACGFTANLDRVAALDREMVDRLFAERPIVVARQRVTRADSVADLLAGVAQCVASGEGCDLPVRDPAVQDWLLERVDGRVQVGGTGAQAAATLAMLGFPILLHLTGRSREQIAALPGRERIAIGSPDGLVPIDAGSDPDDPTMWHVVLEFAEGLRVPLLGEPVAPSPNRAIVSYDPVNAAFVIDPWFAAALGDPSLEIGALLVSGFSQVTDPGTLERVLAGAAEAIRAWRAARPELSVHLELGAMPDPASVARVLEVLHPRVTSVGLNIDELRGLLLALGVTMAEPGPRLVAQLRCLAERYPAPRFSLHTREFCLTLTDGDAQAERDALLFGALVAATRSRIGDFPAPADLAATLACSEVNPAGLALLRSLGIAADGYADGGIVAAPGLRIDTPVASVGLGDSFTGGVLAML